MEDQDNRPSVETESISEYEIFDTPTSKRRRAAVALLSVLIVVILAFLTAFLLKTYVFDTFTVDGNSMNPTLNGGSVYDPYDGETLILNRVAKIERGDIVVFSPGWENVGSSLVKRVIAVAGDHLVIDEDGVFLNGKLLDEPYIAEAMDPVLNVFIDIVVSENSIFCMGDNRNHSSDCRHHGEVSLDTVNGKCVFVVDTNGGIRIAK